MCLYLYKENTSTKNAFYDVNVSFVETIVFKITVVFLKIITTYWHWFFKNRHLNNFSISVWLITDVEVIYSTSFC